MLRMCEQNKFIRNETQARGTRKGVAHDWITRGGYFASGHKFPVLPRNQPI